MTDPVPLPGDRDLLAAELALGVLEGDDLAAAQRQRLADPAFADAVETWEQLLAGLALETVEEAVPVALWQRVEAAIAETPDTVASIVPLQRLRRWQFGAGAAGAVAAALAILLMLPRPAVEGPPPDRTQPVASRPAIVAQLRGEDAGPIIAARYDPQTAQLRLAVDAMGESDLAPELWVIPDDGVPRSLGLIAPTGDTQLTVAQGHRTMIRDGATLAVTMEPRASAPHQAPSSAPVASGKIFGI
ncbi:anti-sigma factor [Sphingomonas sp. ST-64]|uniref:Anti-sigma factor n=1 Tax=Sphingomonas plantiphila TaxID=3163295 RepID=A0ABW8YQK5_9SPHN